MTCVPLADGTMVATLEMPSDDLIPGLLAASDVMGTGWFAADGANVKPGSTVAVVGDGAVGLCRVIAARQMGAERITMMQSIRSTRAGGHVGFVGVSHGVSLPGEELFFAEVHLFGGPAPVRCFLPQLIDLIWSRKIDLGKVFDLALPLDEVAAGCRAMDQRRAIKVLLYP